MDLEIIYAITGYIQGAMWSFTIYAFIAGVFSTIWWFIPR